MKPLTAMKYDAIGAFSEGISPFKFGDLWGFLDYTGKEIIPATYDNVENFYGGKSNVTLKGERISINKQGIIIPDKIKK